MVGQLFFGFKAGGGMAMVSLIICHKNTDDDGNRFNIPGYFDDAVCVYSLNHGLNAGLKLVK